MKPIFLDHAAGSPLRPEVLRALEEHKDLVPNPNGAHAASRRSRAVLEESRERVAELLGCTPREVLFTSGGTESANMGVFAGDGIERVLISAIEHTAVFSAAVARDVPHLELRVESDGVLDLDEARASVQPGDLVSVMAANSETGAIQPVVELVDSLGEIRSRVLIHSDAVAAASCHDLRPLVARCDLVTLAGHKLGAPAGIGVLVAKAGVTLTSLSYGGAQEAGVRSGTQNVLGALAMSVALEAAIADQAEGRTHAMRTRRDRLEAVLLEHSGVEVSAATAPRLEGHCHVTVGGARSEELLLLLDQRGLCVAAGSACSSGAPQASRVLLAMGVNEARARGALRFTLSTSTTDGEIDRACSAVHETLAQLVG